MKTSDKHIEEDSFRDKLSTVDEKGKRIWLYPKKPFGKWFNKRLLFGYTLLAFLIMTPFIYINGEPMIMFNIIERKFTLFGKVFWPQDFYIFALAMIAGVIFIALFTLVFGRLFCGWACPQTVFMELVFRRIEYWIEGDWKHQQKFNKQPWNGEKIIKKASKHIIFGLISFFIANVFLAYIIGYKELFLIVIDNPANHVGGLVAILIFSSLFYGVFAFMREQVCTTVCPYGRLQGVLLDKDSMVITYDYIRGESRAKFKKNENREEVGKGDCIDCKQCINVCPTGIDIRNGTQLECVNCTACIDACDHIMKSIKKPKGLIRYASDQSIKTGSPFRFTLKAKAYSIVLVVLMGLISTLIVTRSSFDMNIKRTDGGIPYHRMGNGIYSNIYDINIINKSNEEYDISFHVIEGEAEVVLIGSNNKLDKQAKFQASIMVKMHYDNINKLKTPIVVGVYSNGKLIDQEKVYFVGPAI